MNVKKVLVLSEEEIAVIMSCGKLLREIDNGLKDRSIDELAPDTINLVTAVGEIARAVLGETELNNEKELNG